MWFSAVTRDTSVEAGVGRSWKIFCLWKSKKGFKGGGRSVTGLPLAKAKSVSWLEDIDFSRNPKVYYLHRARVKEGAQTVVTAGGKPFLVTGTYGNGRVVCVLGMPYGAPAEGEVGFWAWDDWAYLMRNASLWAFRK